MISILRAPVRRCFTSSSRQLQSGLTLEKVGWSIGSISDRPMPKRKFEQRGGGGSYKKQQRVVKPYRFEGSHEEVLVEDIKQLLLSSKDTTSTSENVETTAEPERPEKFSEIEVRIAELSSTGDAIGFSGDKKDHAYVVPFSLPGELVKAKIIRTDPGHGFSTTDFLEVIESSPRRDSSLVKCQYFAKCSGCQFQMIPYQDQLEHKKTIIEKAYKNFSGLPADNVPAVGDTIGSPLEYGYRTKLTPHFDGPPGVGFRNKSNQRFEKMPEFGFMQKNTRWTIDIEDCPIGTRAVRDGLTKERERLAKEFGNYSRGSTTLLRESTERKPRTEADGETKDGKAYEDIKTCITDSKAISTEYVADYIFTNPAGAFFQNNNSILPVFTEYIKNQIIKSKEDDSEKPLNYLIDAYCGSGLFTITLSSLFKSSAGIDIAEQSISHASKNAELNEVKNAKFIAATAAELFKSVSFGADETLVVIDPPRKGCDDDFLNQLLRFGPRKVAYVSCNVHTQARDIGTLVNGLPQHTAKYKIDSLRGFDFFPQTGHVESVAFLSRTT